ncbi:hypothetical protein D4T97_005995 [Siminovitchia acidinfaciens]|uniref:Uncharacterized protein n=1 Tax=Siminovitchia acidinfaciens TaxID=2321395 RepID=A0A429Y4G7_9BACI|nr:hypothetical protein D4T97_005995 [Siminovitchia acidinfaciens]
MLNRLSEKHQRILIINKGSSTPVSLDGSNTPTQFTVMCFDPDNCCATFSFEEIVDTSPMKMVPRIFIADCRSIAGIVSL